MSIKYYSQEGYDNMMEELNHLKTKGRSEMSRQIAEAREKGDLSENAEYDAAKEAQGLLEMKIAKLELELGQARVLDEDKVNTSKVMILSVVKIKNLKFNRVMKYQIVSDNEADLKTGKISINSPIAQGLFGKEKGDVVEIEVPAGTIKLEIMEVSRA